MKATDPRATNLFCRLLSYVPSHGEVRIRRPLEDFSTEALAYLLTHSEELRNRFVGVTKLRTKTGDYVVHTQAAEEVVDRVDLLLESVDASDTIAVEVKIALSTHFQKDQLARYIDRYQKVVLLAPRTYIARAKKDEAIIQTASNDQLQCLSWESLYDLLKKFSLEGTESIHACAGEFCDFLASQNLKSFEMKTNPNTVRSLGASAGLISEWNHFLLKVHGELIGRAQRSQRMPFWESKGGNISAESDLFLIKGAKEAYMGFEINGDKVNCFLEEAFKGKAIYSDGNGITVDPWPGQPMVTVKIRKSYPEAPADIATELESSFTSMLGEIRGKASLLNLESLTDGD